MKRKTYIMKEIIFAEKPTHFNFKDIEDQIFGKLTVLGYAGKFGNNDYHHWWVQCDCKNKTVKKVSTSNLKSNHTKSCGCLERKRIHNMCNTSEYYTFNKARFRCENTSYENFEYYSGRGIEFRFKDFEEFYQELGEKPEPKHLYSIERIDNEGHYEIGNVKWAIREEQVRNMRSNVWITFNGENKILQDWANLYSIKSTTLSKRIFKLNWCVECSLNVSTDKTGRKRKVCQHNKQN